MKRFTLLTMLLLMGFTAATFAEPQAEEQQTPQQRSWRLIDDGALLIDVRSRQEYEAAHLDAALNIPHDDVEQLVEAIGSDKDRDVVVYCRSGKRAGLAKDALENIGYKNIYNGMGYEDLKKARNLETPS